MNGKMVEANNHSDILITKKQGKVHYGKVWKECIGECGKSDAQAKKRNIEKWQVWPEGDQQKAGYRNRTFGGTQKRCQGTKEETCQINQIQVNIQKKDNRFLIK
jgi:hypothetical protein